MLALVKVEPIDDVQQPRAAEDLLGDALQALLQVIVDVRGNVVFGHAGLLHQNQRARLVTRRKHPTRTPNDCPPKKQWYQKVEVAAAHHAQIVLQVEAF